MADRGLGTFLRHLRDRARAERPDERTDGGLLRAFQTRGDAAAFAALVERHGGLVLGVCRRVLHNEHDAEDAFQATFLLLAQTAGSVRKPDALGSWLHGVAYRMATSARRAAQRRRRHETGAQGGPRVPPDDLSWREVQAAIDEELQRLPEHFRTAFVLCALENRPTSQVARELGVKEGTVWSRVAKARKRLMQRLTERGVVPAGAAALALAVPRSADAVPDLLSAATRRVVAQLAANRPVADVIPAAVAALVKGAQPVMNTSRFKIAALVLFALVGAGVGVAASGTPDAPPTKGPVPPGGQPKGEVPPVKPEGVAKDEPEWRKAFNRAYALADGEVLKRIAAPFPKARGEFYKNWTRGTTGLDEKVGLIVGWDGRNAEIRTMITRGFGLGALMNLGLGIPPPEVEGDRKLLLTVIEGDVIARSGTAPEKFCAPLERVFKEATGREVKITVREAEREVVVVRGTYAFKQARNVDPNALGLFARDPAAPPDGPKTTPPIGPAPPNAGAVRPQGGGTGALPEFLDALGRFINYRVINEVEKGPGARLVWREFYRNPASEEQWSQDRAPAAVLANVSAQSGLTFKTEMRKVRVVFVDAR
jgi:RNA polymerase sigma factor (sigma-70 family)